MNAHQKIIKDNARTILKIITKYYGCKYSAALYVILKEHPDFPVSYLSSIYYIGWAKIVLPYIPVMKN